MSPQPPGDQPPAGGLAREQVFDSVGIVVDSVGIVVDSAGIVVDSVGINHHQVAQWCSELQTAREKNT